MKMSFSSSDNDSLDSDSWEEESDNQLDEAWPHYYSWDEKANIQSIKDYIHLPWDLARNMRNFEMIRRLVEHDLTSINYQNLEGVTLLMLAAADSSDARGVYLLHERGAKTGICDNQGRMALHFAANSGNVELLQYMLQNTETSCIEQWFMNIPNVLQARHILHSLVGCAIHSENVKCLEILLSSNKLSKSILQAPFVKTEHSNICNIYSPLAYVFNLVHFTDEKLNSYLELLLKHKITMLDEFFREHNVKWPHDQIKFQNPFSKIFHDTWPFSKQLHYFNWLNENDVTIDYCLQSYHDNTQPFATFTDYKHYYEPVINVLSNNNMEALKLIISNSAILEPDELIIQLSAEAYELIIDESLVYISDINYTPTEGQKNLYKYLISLKPIYYKKVQLCNRAGQEELSWYPYSTISEEFSKSTLQQLCRTTIRHHVRKYTLEDNLYNFRKSIFELPLPPAMKKFLLFEN